MAVQLVCPNADLLYPGRFKIRARGELGFGGIRMRRRYSTHLKVLLPAVFAMVLYLLGPAGAAPSSQLCQHRAAPNKSLSNHFTEDKPVTKLNLCVFERWKLGKLKRQIDNALGRRRLPRHVGIPLLDV